MKVTRIMANVATGDLGKAQRDPGTHGGADEDHRALHRSIDHRLGVLDPAADRAILEPATGFAMPSAGNAGGAAAAYCARGGFELKVFMPQDASEANKKRMFLDRS